MARGPEMGLENAASLNITECLAVVQKWAFSDVFGEGFSSNPELYASENSADPTHFGPNFVGGLRNAMLKSSETL